MVSLALMLSSAPTAVAEGTQGGLCEEAPCDTDSTLRVVEYFGADWCEPCRPVEAMLDGLDREDVLVVRHAPSPQDPGYSNLSFHRFDGHYGLLSLPAIVIDGHAVLSGETMTLRLEEALNATASDAVLLNENRTEWSSPVFAPAGPHGLDVNVSSSLPGSANGTWTVALFDIEPPQALVAALPAPESNDVSTTPAPLSSAEITLLTAALALLCAPATVMLWRSMNDDQPAHLDEES
ncbi:MAG TPA: hypothetical protein HA286_02230 [Candidatus Poseidoniaceae archaeon]|nr:hypothetical protein [Candidatus Poseidoniaceae archaeon]